MGRGIEISISDAKRKLKNHQEAFGKRGTRIHVEAAVHKTNQLRILNGALCAHCRFFHAFNNGMAPNGYAQIELICGQRLDPIEIYRNTPFLDDPQCDEFKKK